MFHSTKYLYQNTWQDLWCPAIESNSYQIWVLIKLRHFRSATVHKEPDPQCLKTVWASSPICTSSSFSGQSSVWKRVWKVCFLLTSLYLSLRKTPETACPSKTSQVEPSKFYVAIPYYVLLKETINTLYFETVWLFIVDNLTEVRWLTNPLDNYLFG